jgi:hypothetical protein
LLELMSERYAQLKVSAQEVYGSDVADLLLSGAVRPRARAVTSFPAGIRQRLVRREVLRLAASADDPVADAGEV